MNAVVTSKNAIIFNPANPNFSAVSYKKAAEIYTKKIESYVVKGEMLNSFVGQDPVYTVKEIETNELKWDTARKKHSMEAVIDALIKEGYK